MNIYKSPGSKVFIPLTFETTKNEAGINAATSQFSAKMESFGLDEVTIMDYIKTIKSSTIDSSVNTDLYFLTTYKDADGNYKTEKLTNMQLDKWQSKYNYIESMQYDYESNNCIQIKINTKNIDISIGGSETYTPVIVEFIDDYRFSFNE